MNSSEDPLWLLRDGRAVRIRIMSYDARERLLVVRGIDEVAARLEVGIEELEGELLVHGAYSAIVPLVTDAHATKDDG